MPRRRSWASSTAMTGTCEQRLQLLLEYRSEYTARLARVAQTGMHSVGWRNFREFIDKIDAAIEQQREARGRSQATRWKPGSTTGTRSSAGSSPSTPCRSAIARPRARARRGRNKRSRTISR